MRITPKVWNDYIARLRRVDERAKNEMLSMINRQSAQYNAGAITLEEYENIIIDYAYALATRYGEAAGAAACEMYDAIAEVQKANVPAAVPARTATFDETARAVIGTMKTGNNEIVAASVGRLTKMVSVDTMQQNALRDGAEWAWIPRGDTCAFCLMLASNGWQKASKNAIKNGHAEHVHANCDCTYAVRFDNSLEVEGYNDGKQYRDMYYNFDGIDESVLEKYKEEHGGLPVTPEGRLDIMRRQMYAENKDAINAQKRSAYEKRKERNSSAAEELNVD